MNGFIELALVVLDLCKAVIQFPADWDDEEQVKAWLHTMEEYLAKVITLLMPDEGQDGKVRLGNSFSSYALQKFKGAKADDFDWGQIVDWVAMILKQLFPQYAAIINVVVSLIKQFIDLLLEKLQGLDAKTLGNLAPQ